MHMHYQVNRWRLCRADGRREREVEGRALCDQRRTIVAPVR
jgi:hypothetical protein